MHKNPREWLNDKLSRCFSSVFFSGTHTALLISAKGAATAITRQVPAACRVLGPSSTVLREGCHIAKWYYLGLFGKVNKTVCMRHLVSDAHFGVK